MVSRDTFIRRSLLRISVLCFLQERLLLPPLATKLVNAMTLLLPIKGDMLSLCMGLNGQIRGVKRFCFTIHLEDFQSYRKMPRFPTTDLLQPSPGGDLHFGRQMSKTSATPNDCAISSLLT